MLESRLRVGPRVFELSESTLLHQHQSLRDKLGLDSEFVLHSLRHSILTRPGEAGVDAFTINALQGILASQFHRSTCIPQQIAM